MMYDTYSCTVKNVKKSTLICNPATLRLGRASTHKKLNAAENNTPNYANLISLKLHKTLIYDHLSPKTPGGRCSSLACTVANPPAFNTENLVEIRC